MADKGAAVRKRQQIENANRMMFLWVAAASAIVGIAIVVSVSLYERMLFNEKVLSAKSETVDNLKNNNDIVDELERNVRVLNTNQNLIDTPRPEGRAPISVILDALPSQANSSALGASLQQRLLDEGVTIEALTVDPIAGAEAGGDDSGSTSATTSSDTASESSVQMNNFTFTISAGSDEIDTLRDTLRKIERSIRTINVRSVEVERQGGRVSMVVSGVAYFLPEKQVKLENKPETP